MTQNLIQRVKNALTGKKPEIKPKTEEELRIEHRQWEKEEFAEKVEDLKRSIEYHRQIPESTVSYKVFLETELDEGLSKICWYNIIPRMFDEKTGKEIPYPVNTGWAQCNHYIETVGIREVEEKGQKKWNVYDSKRTFLSETDPYSVHETREFAERKAHERAKEITREVAKATGTHMAEQLSLRIFHGETKEELEAQRKEYSLKYGNK